MPDPLKTRFAMLLPPLLRLAALAAIGGVIGFFLGAAPALWAVVIGLSALLAIHMTYAMRLAAWLEKPKLDDMPNGWGLWSDVFTRLYRQRRKTEANERRLVENEERFRRTISALPEGIVLIDAALQIDWCNPVAEEHLGVRLSADQGLRLTNLVRDPDFINYMTSGHFEAPLVFRPLAQAGLALEVRVVDFEPARSIIITRDITQRERVDAVRRDFIANVSHELRTPLTVVSGFLETLLDARPGDEATRRRVVAYTAGLLPVTVAPYFFGLVGPVYFTVASAAGLWFLYRSVRLFQERTDEAARGVFRVSLVFLFAVFLAMLVDLMFGL